MLEKHDKEQKRSKMHHMKLKKQKVDLSRSQLLFLNCIHKKR